MKKRYMTLERCSADIIKINMVYVLSSQNLLASLFAYDIKTCMESLDKLSWYTMKHAINESMNVILIDETLVHDF
jgi:hypothetical protein